MGDDDTNVYKSEYSTVRSSIAISFIVRPFHTFASLHYKVCLKIHVSVIKMLLV